MGVGVHCREERGRQLTFSAFIVADVTMSLRSLLLDRTTQGWVRRLLNNGVERLTLAQETHEYIRTE